MYMVRAGFGIRMLRIETLKSSYEFEDLMMRSEQYLLFFTILLDTYHDSPSSMSGRAACAFPIYLSSISSRNFFQYSAHRSLLKHVIDMQ